MPHYKMKRSDGPLRPMPVGTKVIGGDKDTVTFDIPGDSEIVESVKAVLEPVGGAVGGAKKSKPE